MRNWLVRQVKQPVFIPIILGVVAAVLPSINVLNNYILSGDSARDLLDLYRSYAHHVIPLVGPSASVGGFHVGPLFYYLILPPLAISQFDPITPVLVAILINVLTVLMGYKLIKDFATKRAALYFGILAACSPYLVHLARGSWNPNPQPLVSLVLLYALMKLIERPSVRYMLILGLTVGCGIQLHYTFLSNVFTSMAILLVLRPRIFANWKLYPAVALGVVLPLIPFAVGQAMNNLVDIRGLVHYLRASHMVFADLISPKLFAEHFMSPFLSFFAPIGNSPVAVAFLAALWISVVALVVLAARSNGPGRKLATVALLFFAINTLQAHAKGLALPYYFLFYSAGWAQAGGRGRARLRALDVVVEEVRTKLQYI